jgi:hypothetical protein
VRNHLRVVGARTTNATDGKSNVEKSVTKFPRILSVAMIAGSLVAGATGANAVYITPDRYVTIFNDSPDDIVSLYAINSDQGDDSWEQDVLGSRTLWSGRRFDFNIRTHACVFDFRAVFDDGSEHIYRNINVCSRSRLAFK